MTSRLWTLLKVLGPRSASTANQPNSWAVVSLWRRLFAQKREDEERALDVLYELFGIRSRPIADPRNCQLLLEFTRDGHRINAGQPPLLYSTHFPTIMRQAITTPTSTTSNETITQVTREAQQLYSPNLSIPDGNDNYLTRAQ